MGDLMKAGTVDYKTLGSKYNNFMVPAVRVNIGGSSYSSVTGKESKKGSMLVIYEAEANLYHWEGSSVTITVGDAYDLKGSRFKELASLGETMSVEVGYNSTFSEIFKGFVGEITSEFRGTQQCVRITGYDAVSLMRQHQASRFYTKKKYSDIVNEIIGRYSGILSAETVETTGEEKQDFISGRCMDDFEYLHNVLCPLAGKEFYIFDGKAYFQAISKRNKTPSVEFKLGKGLYDFRMTEAYANLEVSVRGITGAQGESPFVSTVKGKVDSSQKTAGSGAQTQYIQWTDVTDSNTAKNYAQYTLDKQIAARQLAEGKCIGIPEIIPGRCLKIKGIRPALDSRKFWVDHVVHHIGKDGFSTDFYVKGWA